MSRKLKKVWKKIERFTIRRDGLIAELAYRKDIYLIAEKIPLSEIDKQARMAGEIEELATKIEFLKRKEKNK